MMSEFLVIKGAREHNLKNISISIPRDKFIVFTGLSGSGKSSLAFDTIYAEGQRRYMESLSFYARQFLSKLEKPNVDSIDGLSPTIAIEQKTTHNNPRSTVGTITEIYDFLRLLFSRLGVPHCPTSGRLLQSQSVDTIVDRVLGLLKEENQENIKIQILSPIIQNKKGEFKDLFEHYTHEGFVRVRIDNKVFRLEEVPKLVKNQRHTIELVVDRLVLKYNDNEIASRLSDSIEIALKHGKQMVRVLYEVDEIPKEEFFSSKLYSPDTQQDFPEITHRLFSFNSPEGACSKCSGLGFLLDFHPKLLIPDKNQKISEGIGKGLGWSNNSFWYLQIFRHLAKSLNFSIDSSWSSLSPEIFHSILYGDPNIQIEYKWSKEHDFSFQKFHEGFIPNLMRRYKETKSSSMRSRMEKYMAQTKCGSCDGTRLNKWARNVFFHKKPIFDFTNMSIEQAHLFFQKLKLDTTSQKIASQILDEIQSRLFFLQSVGLGYLTLNRLAGTLSGGEAQRIRLATQIGSTLVGVLYILDEPSIGLHQSDNAKLIQTLIHLRDLGNTVIVIEHDEDTMRASDYIVDIGPRAGKQGGHVVFEGTFQKLLTSGTSLTADYLTKRKYITVPSKRKEVTQKQISVFKASENNLKKIDVHFPLGIFICVTGVSGSGKSTLIHEVLYKSLINILRYHYQVPGKHQSIEGLEYIDKAIRIDQSSIGRTPRSNPATYTGVFTPIRELFAELTISKQKGFLPGRFSFNVAGGRCEECEGDGVKKIEMHFLSDVFVTCEVCQGKRYNRETLEVCYKGKNIHEILNMTVTEALEFFSVFPLIKPKLQALFDVGLSYISLGQSSTTLSGGEAQRIKLASELCKRSTGKTLYILDEPTTGLHFEDIRQLLLILHRFVDQGNSVIVIEHNLDVIKTADYIIDLGPEGGLKGGDLIFEGTPEQLIKCKKSLTGKFLKSYL